MSKGRVLATLIPLEIRMHIMPPPAIEAAILHAKAVLPCQPEARSGILVMELAHFLYVDGKSGEWE